MESRRNFIKTISTATASLKLSPLINQIHTKENYMFISECNKFSQSLKPFTLGILKVSSIIESTTEIKAVRNKNHYRSILRYRSTDKFKFPYAKDLIDYFTKEKSISFFGRTILGDVDSRQEDFMQIKTLTYYLHYRKAISDALSQHEMSTLFLGIHDVDLKAYLLKEIPAIKEIKFIKDDLYQFSQFLTGSVSADESSVFNEIKVSLIKYLKVSLGIKETNKLSTSTSSKFKIARVRI